MDDVVDPSASFRELPRFLTEGLLLTSDRMCQQLRLLLSDVPTSGVHGACRKLQRRHTCKRKRTMPLSLSL